MPRWDSRPFDRACALLVAATGLAMFGLSWAMAASPLQPPVILPELGGLVAIMLVSRVAAWPALLVAASAGLALAGGIDGAACTGLSTGIATAVAAGLAAYGWKAACRRGLCRDPLLGSTVFIGIAAVAAPATAALVASALDAGMLGLVVPAQDLPGGGLTGWTLSNAVGVLLLGWPTALARSDPALVRGPPGRRREAIVLVCAAAGLAALLIPYGPMACILVLQPVFVLAAVRLGIVGLAALLGAAAVAATLGAGWAPPGLSQPDILALRTFFAGAVLCLFPVPIILHRTRAALVATELNLEDAVRTSQAKSDFLTAMSHDIRIPLTSMIGFADLLGGLGLDPVVARRAKLIHDSGLAILGMLEDISKFAILEASDPVTSPAPTCLRALLSATVAGMEPQARLRRQTLRLSIAPDVPEWVMADAPRLRQVLTNLVSNAIKFGHDGAVEVTLRCGRNGPAHLFFAVRDSGPGLTEEEQSKLFRPLIRLDNPATRAVGGTGLGLAICRQYVEAMPGGVIGVTSRVGVGSTFWFEATLPACPAPEAAQPLPGPGSAAEMPHSHHVLVAEDFVAGQKVIAAILHAEGHTTSFVTDGQQAVTAAQAGGFDLILMDMDMPVMDGLAAARAIRRSEAGGRHVPLIALTGSVSREDIERCLAAGMDGHLAKPIDRAALRAELSRHALH